MPSLNKVVLVGRLTRDPELRYTASNLALATFSIAVDRPFKDPQTGEKKTDFFRCKAWRQKAEFVSSYAQKGRLVAVDGRIETSEIVGPDGQKKYFTDIVCDNVEILDSNRDVPGDAPLPQGGGQAQGGGQGGQGYDDGGNGYFPDDEAAPARPQRPAPAAQASPQRQAPAQPAPSPQRATAPAGAAPAPRGGAGRPAPAAAYPADDDFDDSDPFADE